jgi:hypothetical protein
MTDIGRLLPVVLGAQDLQSGRSARRGFRSAAHRPLAKAAVQCANAAPQAVISLD